MMPNYMRPHADHHPDLLLSDLLATSTLRDSIITVEDKDPSKLWVMNNDLIIKFWRDMLRKADDRWQVIQTKTTNVVIAYHRLLNTITPRNLLSGPNAFGTKNLPYVYFTIKHKCFQACRQMISGQTIPPAPDTLPTSGSHFHQAHTCCTEGHSCLRNIVSVVHLPAINTFRRMGRAFIHGVRSVMPGYGLSNLSTSRGDILKPLDEQCSRNRTHDHVPCCAECGACMSGPTLYTADAGQAYEMVKPSTIESSFSKVFNAIRSTSRNRDPTMSVIHSVRANAKFGGWISDRLFGRTVFFLPPHMLTGCGPWPGCGSTSSETLSCTRSLASP